MISVTRRRLAALSVASAATLAGGKVLAQTDATPTGEWSFTDLEGNELTLPETPIRIAANLVIAAALWDLGIKCVAVFDWTAGAYPDGDHIAWGNIDASQVEIISDENGYILPEKLVAADVEVLFAQTFELGNPEEVNGVPSKTAATINEIAPVMIVTDMDLADIQVERIAVLAESLGADLSIPEIVAMKEAFETTVEDFRTVAAEKSDLVSLFLNADAAELYIAGPGNVSDLQFLASLGMQFANADSEFANDYWETLSSEQALLYPTDIVYADVYSGLKTQEEFAAVPSFAAMPAVQAGQIGLWERDYPYSYLGVTRFLETILVTLRDAQKVI